MRRPTGIAATTFLMALFLVWGAVGLFMTPLALPAGTQLPAQTLGAVAHAGGLVFTLVAAVFVFFYWKGQDWARWLVLIYSLFALVGLIGIHKAWMLSHQAAVLSGLKAVLAVYLLWYRTAGDGKTWFTQKRPEAPAVEI